jgi:hypothetical protein
MATDAHSAAAPSMLASSQSATTSSSSGGAHGVQPGKVLAVNAGSSSLKYKLFEVVPTGSADLAASPATPNSGAAAAGGGSAGRGCRPHELRLLARGMVQEIGSKHHSTISHVVYLTGTISRGLRCQLRAGCLMTITVWCCVA